jgi:hypothetical protein
VSVGRILELSPRVWAVVEVAGEEELDGPLVEVVMGSCLVRRMRRTRDLP